MIQILFTAMTLYTGYLLSSLETEVLRVKIHDPHIVHSDDSVYRLLVEFAGDRSTPS